MLIGYKNHYYCDVPIMPNSVPYRHSEITLVASVIHCGVDESNVIHCDVNKSNKIKVAVKDMEEMEEHENTDTD